jgi:hypothetical protein
MSQMQRVMQPQGKTLTAQKVPSQGFLQGDRNSCWCWVVASQQEEMEEAQLALQPLSQRSQQLVTLTSSSHATPVPATIN